MPGRRPLGLIMCQILKFPGSVSGRTPKDGTPKEAIAGTEAGMPSPVMTGDQWREFIRLLTPDEQQAFMADVWKLINRYCRQRRLTTPPLPLFTLGR